jgi:sulfur dioxygenase
MIFRQLFDRESSTYTYVLASREGGEALLIDPVREQASVYVQLLEELGVRLVFAIDTHVHADHITALGLLREQTKCVTIMGRESKAACVSRTVQDGEVLDVDGLKVRALYTPGHTDDSYSFVAEDRIFTGDTLLIRGSGRTDFQNGDPAAQYDSIFTKILPLGDALFVYPGHDYRGFTVSTIGEERRHNPRLRVASKQAYVEQMRALRLPNPKLMDLAVPANLACGKTAT